MFQTLGATCAKALRWGTSLLKFNAQEGGQSGWSRVREPRVADSAESVTWGLFILTLLISGSARWLARAWVCFLLPPSAPHPRLSRQGPLKPQTPG